MNKITAYFQLKKGNMLLLLCFFLFFFISCENNEKSKSASTDYYTCPMHLQIKLNNAGVCPICKMELVEESSLQLHHINIQVNDMIKATNEAVLSNIKIIKPAYSSIPVTINTKGIITYDPKTFSSIASRYKGRIEKLYLRFRFERVKKGQKLFDIYSPEMITTQQNLIFLIQSGSTQLIENAKQKLYLLGLTEGQVNELVVNKQISRVLSVYSPVSGYILESKEMPAKKEEMGKDIQAGDNSLSIKEGMYVDAGQEIFKVVNTEIVWAVIKVFAPDVELVKDSQHVTITTESGICNGKVNLIEPFFEDGNKAINVRVCLGNERNTLKINEWVEAKIETGEVKGWWIPQSAILDMGKQKIVFIKKGNAFVAREIKIGTENKGQIQVDFGIDEHSEIAEHAQYLVDSESFLQIEK